MKLFGKPGVKEASDRFELKAGPDGSLGECWFCGSTVTMGEDSAVMFVERVPVPKDPIHAVCHVACAQRAKGF
jgi:hypothetical protein